MNKTKLMCSVALVCLLLSINTGCAHDKPSQETSQQLQSSISSSASENADITFDADQVAQAAFDVWRLMGYKPLSFFTDNDINVENLAELYTEFCMNSKSDDQLLAFSQDEHLNTEFEKYINQHFFKMPGFIDFSKKYFNISIDKTTTEKYEETIDAYPLSPAYLYFDDESVTQISLESYERNKNDILLYINYTNQGVYELIITVDSDGNFIFSSLNDSGG